MMLRGKLLSPPLRTSLERPVNTEIPRLFKKKKLMQPYCCVSVIYGRCFCLLSVLVFTEESRRASTNSPLQQTLKSATTSADTRARWILGGCVGRVRYSVTPSSFVNKERLPLWVASFSPTYYCILQKIKYCVAILSLWTENFIHLPHDSQARMTKCACLVKHTSEKLKHGICEKDQIESGKS